MSKFIKKHGIVLGVVALLAFAGAAYAYFTVDGSGTATANAKDAQAALTVNQTVSLAPMYPGDQPQTLSGDFDNPNSGSLHVGTVTAEITSVVKAGDAPAGTCDATDFTLADAGMTVDADVPAGSAKGSWTGATIQFNDKASNQDACKGATVNLRYTIS